MRQIDLFANEWLDIVFEDRNKEYGAYVLRQDTGKRNLWAIISLGVVFVTGVGIFYLTHAYESYKKVHTSYENVIEFIDMSGKNKTEPIKPKTEVVNPERVVEKVVNSIKFVAPRIVKDEEARPEDMLRTQDEVMHALVAIGSIDVTNGSDNGVVQRLQDVIAQPEPKPAEEDKVVDVVEQMPSFPGGQGELMAYLAKNIHYPIICQEQGIQGRVVCSFIVEKDGSITDIKIVRSIDPNLDREAVRVLRSMPRWIPGMQNGRAVRVKYNVPVNFRLQ